MLEAFDHESWIRRSPTRASAPGLKSRMLIDEPILSDFVNDERGVLGPFGLPVDELDADQNESLERPFGFLDGDLLAVKCS